jgi:tetratricopeptide (TPR) repeat protein
MTTDRVIRPWLVAALLLSGWTAWAQPGEQDPRELAKTHYAAGRALRESGDYAGAFREYLIAYQLAPTPEMLFNLGVVYRQSHDFPHAVEYFQKYLAASPRGRGSAQAQAYLAELPSTLPPASPSPEPPLPPAAPAPSPGVMPAAAAGASAANAGAGHRSWVAPGLAFAGLGVGIAGAALLGSVGAYAQSHQGCIAGGTCPVADMHTERTMAYAGYALAAIGGAAAVAGVIGWIVSWRHARPERAWAPSGAHGWAVTF